MVKQYILFDMFAFIFFVRGLDVVERENVFVSLFVFVLFSPIQDLLLIFILLTKNETIRRPTATISNELPVSQVMEVGRGHWQSHLLKNFR